MKRPHPRRYLLSTTQWVGAIVLSILLVCFIILLSVSDCLTRPRENTSSLQLTTDRVHQLEELLQNKERATYPSYTYSRDTVALYPHLFNPNTEDSIGFLQLGFRPWMAKNILKYRQSGGVFRCKADLRRIYGMTDELYAFIEPYADLPDTLLIEHSDPLFKPFIQKRDTILELNTCDTASLQMLRGIGPYTALRIVLYRERLGGYVTTAQLLEIDNIHIDSLLAYFTIDSSFVQPIRVNKAGISSLQQHPYISFTQAKALYELRRERFRLRSLEELSALPCFTDSDLYRLAPYLSFED